MTSRVPRNPVVLCHGLFGFDVLPVIRLRYWRGVADALASAGCDVRIPRVGSVASIRTRATQLHEFLEASGAAEYNLIAHSMGGLDARFLISHMPSERSYCIASLTTIATPHRGSSFMDWCRDNLGLGALLNENFTETNCANKSDVLSDILASNSQALAQSGPHPLIRNIFSHIDTPAFSNLTRSFCDAFNAVTPDDPSVSYFSYAAVTTVSPILPLHFSYKIIQKEEGPNDGLVSLTSAKWGEFMGIVDCDHWQLLPPKVRGIANSITRPKFDPVQFYLNLVFELADRGF